jgi:hypothetical protein
VVLPLIDQIVDEQSVLKPLVNVMAVKGSARITIVGNYPEAVWTETCANINELDLGFNQTTTDGFKVAGFIPVCNALLEDSDINLAAHVIHALAVAIATATDAAIAYGTGTNMPTGIVTRLAQAAEPSGYTGEPWVDLTATNLVTYTADASADAETQALDLFTAIANARAATVTRFARGDVWYAMNEATKIKLEVASYALSNQLIVGQVASVLANAHVCDVIADNDIIIGHTEGYVYVDRMGYEVAQSEHVHFIQDNTVFRGKARADGKPVVAKAFAVVNINGQTPASTRTWPTDYANGELGVLTVTAAAGASNGKTVLTVTDKANNSDGLKYLVRGNVNGIVKGQSIGSEWTNLTSGTTAIEAAAGTQIAVVEVDAAGKVVAAGTVASVPKA